MSKVWAVNKSMKSRILIAVVVAALFVGCVGLSTSQHPTPATSMQYTLSGGPSPETPLVVDDDLEVMVNGKTVFIDNDRVSTGDGRARWNGNPITFLASPGDTLRIIATNPGGTYIELSELYLHVKEQSLKLSDGVTQRRSEIYTFFDKEFTISIPTGSISISSTPSGANVYLDGVYKGTTPLSLEDVISESHTVRVVKEGYDEETRAISLGAGETINLDIPLKRLAGSISVSSSPSGASIYLNGIYKGITPITLTDVPIGTYSIKLTKPGYGEVTKTVSVSAGRTKYVSETLTGYGSLSISSTPSAASVYLDGNYKGKTPLSISKVAKGTHSIKLTKSGYVDVTKTVPVSAGETTYVSETLAGYGSLDISSTPSGASVYLDGEYKGETLISISNIVEGAHSIKLTKQGYDGVTKTVSISAGQTTYVSETLKGYGSLDISSTPSGAFVYLDENYMGETPLSISKAAEGYHSIKLTKSGYDDVIKTIQVSAGKTTHISETLSFATWLLASVLGIIALIIIVCGIFVIRRKKQAKPAVSKAEETAGEEKTEEVKIPEPEEVRERLRETYPEKDAARLANAFRIAQEIRNNYCNIDTKAKEINKEFDLLKMYLTEREFLDAVENIQRKINAELRDDERLDEKHVEEVKDFCEKFTEMWIARFLR